MKFWIGWTQKTRLRCIFALALALRLLFILPRGNNIAVPYRDQNTYYILGRALVEDGFLGPPRNPQLGPYYDFRLKHPSPLGSIPEIRLKMAERWDSEKHYYGVVKWGAPTSFFEPLYPLFSALSYWAVGDRFLYPRIFLALMSAFTCIIVFALGRKVFNESAGYIAALICAFYPYFIFYTVFLMSETFLIFLMSATLYYFLRLREKPTAKFAVLFGIVLGLTFLTRSIILGLVPVFMVLLLLKDFKKLLLPSVITILLFVLTISPWIIRNYRLHGELVLLSTRGGYNIWFRNNPFYYQDELEVLGVKVPQKILDGIKYREYLDFPQFREDQGEAERNRILTREGINFLRANPRLFAYLCWVRFKSLLGVRGVLAQGILYRLAGIFSFGVILPLSLLSFFLFYKKWGNTVPLLLVLLYFIAVYTLTHDGIRYRLPADPGIIVLAAGLIEHIRVIFTDKSRKT